MAPLLLSLETPLCSFTPVSGNAIAQPTQCQESSSKILSPFGELFLTLETIDDPNKSITQRKKLGVALNSIYNFLSYDFLSPSYRAFAFFTFFVSIPQDWKETIKDFKWKGAMIKKMKALTLAKNETWELNALPPEGKKNLATNRCSWWHKANGSIERFKVRLVAKN